LSGGIAIPFNIFKGLFGKKEEPKKPEPIELEFSKVIPFIEKKISSESASLEKNVFSKLSEVKRGLKELKAELKNLKETSVETTEGNYKLRKIVNTSKNNLYTHMLSLAEKLSPPSSTDFKELKGYSFNSCKLIGEEINSFGKSIVYTGIILKEPVKVIGEKVKELNSTFTSLKELFESNESFFVFPEVKSSIKKTESKISELDSVKNAINYLKGEISSLEEKMEEKKKELSSLKNSSEASSYNKLIEEKNALTQKKQDLKTDLMQTFSPIEKPLKRFLKLVESRQFVLDKEEEILLNSYLKDPFLALKRDPKGVGLKKILSFLKQLINDNSITLKEKEKEKKLTEIERLLSLDFFDKVFWEFNSIEKEFLEAEKELKTSSLSSKIKSLEEAISSLEKELLNKKSTLIEERKKKERVMEETTLLVHSIESKSSSIAKQPISIKPFFERNKK